MKTKLENIVVKEIDVKEICNLSKIDCFDYVINPYTGCTYDCKFCYACFMRRFAKHKEEWGQFVDVKNWQNQKFQKISGKSVIIGTVTDPYNPLEAKFGRTRKILQELSDIDCQITIQTKSHLIQNDIPLLKKLKNVRVVVSLCTLDEDLAAGLEYELSVASRIETLKKLHKNKIKTTLFISPIMPELTNIKEIIDKTSAFVDEFWFDALELRNEFKPRILNFIWQYYPNLYQLYNDIYRLGDQTYFKKIKEQIPNLCKNKPFLDRIKIKKDKQTEVV